MILAQNWPKTANSSWHCSFKGYISSDISRAWLFKTAISANRGLNCLTRLKFNLRLDCGGLNLIHLWRRINSLTCRLNLKKNVPVVSSPSLWTNVIDINIKFSLMASKNFGLVEDSGERPLNEWMNEWMNECVFIYRTYHIVSQGGLQFFLSEIGRQLVKAPLAAVISPYLISPSYPTHAWNVRHKPHSGGFMAKSEAWPCSERIDKSVASTKILCLWQLSSSYRLCIWPQLFKGWITLSTG